ERRPMIADSWRSRWEYITPFLALPADLRRAVYNTNSIENLNRQIRKAIKTRGHFPDEQAATKLIYLAIGRAVTKLRRAYHWTSAVSKLGAPNGVAIGSASCVLRRVVRVALRRRDVSISHPLLEASASARRPQRSAVTQIVDAMRLVRRSSLREVIVAKRVPYM